MNKHLTHKQFNFVQHYIANSGNGVKAARDAGYKGNDVTLAQVATENLRKPHIQSEIISVRDSLKSTSEATSRAKREILWRLAKYNAEIIIQSKNGIEYMRNPNVVISAISELNKMDGDYAPQQQYNNSEIKVVLDRDDIKLATG